MSALKEKELGAIFAVLNWDDVITTFTCDAEL